MFMHNKRLQFTVRVAEPNPRLASEIIPKTHARVAGGGRATLGIMVGLGAMTFLDTTLG